jgi:hypothetical protein
MRGDDDVWGELAEELELAATESEEEAEEDQLNAAEKT